MTYTIGEFSLWTKITVKALRYYHEEGLLEPSSVDPVNGYRIYSSDQGERASLIVMLKELDFSLAEIKEALTKAEKEEDLRPWIARKLQETEAKAALLRQKTNRLRAWMNQAQEENMNVTFEITTKNIPAFRVASIRTKGKYQDYGKIIGPLFGKMGRWASGAPLCFYYDSEYKDQDADFEPAFPIKDSAPEPGTRKVEPCRAVCLVYQGPYESIGQGYQQIMDYIKTQGFEVKGPTREVYLKGPGMFFKGNPAKYLTEIQFPIKDSK